VTAVAEHTHAGAGNRRLAWCSLAIPSAGQRSYRLPEGSRRDTGGGLRDGGRGYYYAYIYIYIDGALAEIILT